jgi:YHS domain-containing protein
MRKYTVSKSVKKEIFRIAGFVLILAAACICIPAYASGELQAANNLAGSQIKTSLVCMMNNAFMGTEQIPVQVNGKTYYGCCAGCAASLQANTNNIRYAQDPYSGEEVDKAEAFIALKSPATKEVLYFKSEENYKAYSEAFNSQNMSKV